MGDVDKSTGSTDFGDLETDFLGFPILKKTSYKFLSIRPP